MATNPGSAGAPQGTAQGAGPNTLTWVIGVIIVLAIIAWIVSANAHRHRVTTGARSGYGAGTAAGGGAAGTNAGGPTTAPGTPGAAGGGATGTR